MCLSTVCQQVDSTCQTFFKKTATFTLFKLCKYFSLVYLRCYCCLLLYNLFIFIFTFCGMFNCLYCFLSFSAFVISLNLSSLAYYSNCAMHLYMWITSGPLDPPVPVSKNAFQFCFNEIIWGLHVIVLQSWISINVLEHMCCFFKHIPSNYFLKWCGEVIF